MTFTMNCNSYTITFALSKYTIHLFFIYLQSEYKQHYVILEYIHYPKKETYTQLHSVLIQSLGMHDFCLQLAP